MVDSIDSPARGVDFWANTYEDARGLFLECASRAGMGIRSIQHPLRGPSDEKLFTDVARLGSRKAHRTVVILSGTHGVEGYCGSFVQCVLLSSLLGDRLADDDALVFVHAVNPYGFAWRRRATEEGVDLNRNFLDFSGQLPTNPAYDSNVADMLVPRSWTGPQRDVADRAFLRFLEREGVAGLKSVVARGQHDFAEAPFYGGDSPTWANRSVTSLISSECAQSEEIVLIDVHSGLGLSGTAQLIAPRNLDRAELHRAAALWPTQYVHVDETKSVSYALSGGLIDRMPACLPERKWIRVALEFGTRSEIEVVQALRRDHWLHRYGAPRSIEGEWVRETMFNAFFDTSLSWRQAVARIALETMEFHPAFHQETL